MRAIFSILGLLLVVAAVGMLARRAMQPLTPVAVAPAGIAASAPQGASSSASARPDVIKQDVQQMMDETARRQQQALDAAQP